MKNSSHKFLLSILFITFLSNSYAQKSIYKSAYFGRYAKRQKILAIMPAFGSYQMIDHSYSSENTQVLNAKNGRQIQQLIERHLKEKKEKKGFLINIQDSKTTNKLLEKHQILYQDIRTYTVKELSEKLGVDGIIDIMIDLDTRTRGDGNFFSLISSDLHHGRISVKISDSKSSKLIWKYEKSFSSKNKKNTRKMIANYIKQCIREFPYPKVRRSKL